MASSFISDQSTTEENLGTVVATELQAVFNDNTESNQPTESIAATITDIDNIVFSNNTDNINNTIEDTTHSSSQSRRTIDACVQAFESAEERLLLACNNVNTNARSITSNISADDNNHSMSQFVLPTVEQQNQVRMVTEGRLTTADNPQTQAEIKRHIMISYNRESSYDVCQNICDRLRNLGYKVWMDKDDLHGDILYGMALGIENASIVLICYNDKYSKSEYCRKEAAYTVEKGINFIPCLMEASYQPDGWLGIIVSNRLRIDFSSSNDFNSSFKKLLDEIKHIEAQLQIYSSSMDNNGNVQMNNQTLRDRFNTIIREYKQSINKSDDDLHLLKKEELCQLINLLRERLFNDPLLSLDNDKNHCEQLEILRELFKQSQNQTELLTKITEILSKLTNYKTVIKLSLAFLFVWTVKTHIIDAYIKRR